MGAVDLLDARRLVSVKEAAKVLSCSPDHVYDLIARGQLESIDIGGKGRSLTRIRLAELDAYLERNTRRRSA
jgi:excisionase family DNA binding protein